jgi:uncharacterized membrane protein
MATLAAIKFPTADGADKALATLEQLQKQALIQVQDAAVVSWPTDRKQPKTRQAHNLAGAGALGGMFWGMLFGLIFFVPFLGAAVGAAIGAIAGSLTDVGIDDKFVAQVRSQITPGTSALFALTSDAVVDRVADAFKGQQGEIVSTNLSKEQEAKLREVFSAEAATAPRS